MPDQAMSVEAQIAFAQCDDRYDAAFHTLGHLNRCGWTLAVFHVGEGIHVQMRGPRSGPHLCVSGTDNYGDRVTGNIDARGNFCGEPLD